MRVVINPSVQAVAEFMQTQVPASELVSVANAVAALAPLLWGQYEPEKIQSLRLVAKPIVDYEQRKPPSANGSAPVAECVKCGFIWYRSPLDTPDPALNLSETVKTP